MELSLSAHGVLQDGSSASEAIRLWQELSAAESGVPLVLQVVLGSEQFPSFYQLKHLSFQESLFAQQLLDTAASWEDWSSDESAAAFLNDGFNENCLKIGAGTLGRALARRRRSWDFSTAKLTASGKRSLCFLLHENDTLHSLNLQGNEMSAEEVHQLAKALRTARLVRLQLAENPAGDGVAPLAEALADNSRLALLDIRRTEPTSAAFNALCLALEGSPIKDLDVGENSLEESSCEALQNLLSKTRSLTSLGLKGANAEIRRRAGLLVPFLASLVLLGRTLC